MINRQKNNIIAVLISMLMVFAMMPMMTDTVFAETVTKDGITYTLDDVNQTAVVSGHTDDLPAVITIPAIIKIGETEYTVTSIGDEAFMYCYDLKTITIPACVTSIGKSAFRGDICLETVTFETGSNLTSIGESAFADCYDLKTITIPASVTSIGKSAFNDCTSLKDITIPKSVTTLEKDAFANSGLTSVTFETGISLQSIEEGVFQGCGNLSAITIPKSVTNLEKDAFANSGLASVTFETGSRLEVIGYNALGSCGNLKTITIPKSVTSIGEEAFSWGGLQSITFEPGSRLETIGVAAFSKTGLKLIHYLGEEDAWDRVTKGERWAPADTVTHCVPNATTSKATLNADGCIRYICNKEGCSEWSYGELVISRPDKFTLSQSSFTYDGTKKNPVVTVKDSDGKMIDRSNYDVAYSNNVNAGKAIAAVTFKGDRYEGSKRLTFTINKAANPLKMKPKPATVKFKKLKIKDQYLTVGKVITFKNKGQGTVTYALSSAKKGSKSFKKYFKVNKTTGKVTVKKGLKKGKYKVKIKVTAAGNGNYKRVTKPVTMTITVK